MKPKTQVDETCIRVAIRMADDLLHTPGSPLDAALVVPVWRNEGSDKYNAAPAVVGEPGAMPTLVKVLRETADRIEAGDYVVIDNRQPVGEA